MPHHVSSACANETFLRSRGLVAILLSWRWLNSQGCLVTPFFLYKNPSPFLIPLVFFTKLEKNWPWEVIYFLVFPTQKGANLHLLHQNNGMTPVTNIYLISLFKSILPKNACYTSLFSLFLTCTWSNLSQIKSTVKTSINTAVFCTGYLENKCGDTPIFCNSYLSWSLPNLCKRYLKIWPWEDYHVNVLKV